MNNVIGKYFFIAVTFFFCLNSIAQDSLRKKRFYLGVFVSPDYSGVIIPGSNNFYKPGFGYTTGIDLKQDLGKKCSLTFGFYYSAKRYKTDEIKLVFATPDPLAPDKIQFIYNESYLELPLRLDIRFLNKKISPFITNGISTNFFIRETIAAKKIYEDGRIEKNSSPSPFRLSLINVQVQLGFGIDIDLKKTKLQVYPIGRISLTGVDDINSANRFYSIGFGISYLVKI